MKTMMDAKMKGMVMAVMSALCLVLGIMGAMGTTWLVESDPEEDAPEGGYSLTAMHGDMEDAEMCDAFADFMEAGECDGAVYSVSFSEVCDMDEDDDEICDMATGGMIGTIGMLSLIHI